MTSLPKPDAWSVLAGAVRAVMAEGLGFSGRAFWVAARRLKAAAVVLLFALARRLAEEVQPAGPARRATAPLSRIAVRRAPPAPDRWRNPPVTAYRAEPPPSTFRPPSPSRPCPLSEDTHTAKASALLRAILSLCAAPEGFARRLAQKIVASDAVLIAAEAKAFGVNAREQHRRTVRARRFLQQEARARRRRRDSG